MTEHQPLPITIEVGAEREARDAFLWYFDRDPRVALRFEAEVEHALASIAESPLSALEVEPDVRCVFLARFPYSLLYAVEAERIVILAVAHQRRRPGYWHGR